MKTKMKMRTLILLAAGAAILSTPASAVLYLNASFMPTLNSGIDTEGFVGSTWDFTWTFEQETYTNTSDLAAIVSDAASLTISGAINPFYNGTFAITDVDTTNFLAVPDTEGNVLVGSNTVMNDSSFSFGSPSIIVTGLSFFSFEGSIASPGIGDPVLASHFNGVSVSDGAVGVSDGNYDFGSAAVVAVPEPATYAALFGVGVLALALYRRRKALGAK